MSEQGVKSAENVLRLENITMQFGGVVAINNLSMEINEGEIVALIGPNGAGKTTAFNCITGVYQPTNGAVYFHGKPIAAGHPTGRMKRAYAGSDPEKFAHMHVSMTPDRITKLGIARTFQNTRRAVAEHLHLNEQDYVQMLYLLGRECMGALRVHLMDEMPEANYEKLTPAQIRQLAAELQTEILFCDNQST